MSHVFYYIGLPLILLAGLNAYYYEIEHENHLQLEGEKEYVAYPYLNMKATVSLE